MIDFDKLGVSPLPWTWISSDPKADYKNVDALERDDLDPWLASGEVDFGEKARYIDMPMVLEYEGCGSHACVSSIADRRVIASARSTLAMLDRVLEDYERLIRNSTPYDPAVEPLVLEARSVIAAATGEEIVR